MDQLKRLQEQKPALQKRRPHDPITIHKTYQNQLEQQQASQPTQPLSQACIAATTQLRPAPQAFQTSESQLSGDNSTRLVQGITLSSTIQPQNPLNQLLQQQQLQNYLLQKSQRIGRSPESCHQDDSLDNTPKAFKREHSACTKDNQDVLQQYRKAYLEDDEIILSNAKTGQRQISSANGEQPYQRQSKDQLPSVPEALVLKQPHLQSTNLKQIPSKVQRSCKSSQNTANHEPHPQLHQKPQTSHTILHPPAQAPDTLEHLKPPKFEKHLSSSIVKQDQQMLLNRATTLSENTSFLMKQLWVNSAGTRHHKLRDEIQRRNCSICPEGSQPSLRAISRHQLESKYLATQEYYHSKITSDVMYNEPRHMVSIFKDYLIYDDFSEYLKRPYSLSECNDRLPKVFEYYQQYSKLFPTYVGLGIQECKYMFKNIERKQKLIDDQVQHGCESGPRSRLKTSNNSFRQEQQSQFMLFNSQFVKELNADNSKDYRQELSNDESRPHPQRMAIQYIKNQKSSFLHTQSHQHHSNLESIINVISRYMDESRNQTLLVSTSQFSEVLTSRAPVDFDNTMQSFLYEYDAGNEDLTTQKNVQPSSQPRVAKGLAKSTLTKTQKVTLKAQGKGLTAKTKVTKVQPPTLQTTQISLSANSTSLKMSSVKMAAPNKHLVPDLVLNSTILQPSQKNKHKLQQRKTPEVPAKPQKQKTLITTVANVSLGGPKTLKPISEKPKHNFQSGQPSVYNIKGPKAQLPTKSVQQSALAASLVKRSTSNLSSGSGASSNLSSQGGSNTSAKSAGYTSGLANLSKSNSNPYSKVGVRHKLQDPPLTITSGSSLLQAATPKHKFTNKNNQISLQGPKALLSTSQHNNSATNSGHNHNSSVGKSSSGCRVTTPTSSCGNTSSSKQHHSFQQQPISQKVLKKQSTKPVSIFSTNIGVTPGASLQKNKVTK